MWSIFSFCQKFNRVSFVLGSYGSINSSTDKFGKISSIVISTFGSMWILFLRMFVIDLPSSWITSLSLFSKDKTSLSMLSWGKSSQIFFTFSINSFLIAPHKCSIGFKSRLFAGHYIYQPLDRRIFVPFKLRSQSILQRSMHAKI